MIYSATFYMQCPVSQLEHLIEVILSIDEEPADRLEVWGFPVELPPTYQLEIIKVMKNGMEWLDFPSDLTTQIHKHNWLDIQPILMNHKIYSDV